MVQEVVSSGLLLLQHHLLVVLHQVVGGRARVRAALSLSLGLIKWNNPCPKCRKLEFPLKKQTQKELSDNFSNIFELIDKMINSNNLQRSQLFKSLQRRKLIIFFSPNNLLSISSLKIISKKICKKSEKLKSCENLHKNMYRSIKVSTNFIDV